MRIGIDLGGTKIEALALADDGSEAWRERVPTPRGDYMATLAAIEELLQRLQSATNIKAGTNIGIATPGTVSRVSGAMMNCNSACLNGQYLQRDLEQLLGCEVRLANDANCMALSEASDGAASQYSSVFGVILGTGVGGGLVLDKRVHPGAGGIGGEWGHNPIVNLSTAANASTVATSIILPTTGDKVRDCYCGRHNCNETWLSGPALEKSYFEWRGVALDAAAIAQTNDAKPLMEQYFQQLAASLAVVINILDPDCIVFAGGMSALPELCDQLSQRLPAFVFSDELSAELLIAAHGDASGVRGAAWLWP